MTGRDFDLHHPPFHLGSPPGGSAPSEASQPSAPGASPKADASPETENAHSGDAPASHVVDFAVCPACGGRLITIRAKSQCERCRRIVESCCEGGPE